MNLKKILIPILLASTLSACASSPELQKPSSTSAAVSFQMKAQAFDWWQQYEDPELNRLVQLALRENRSIEQAAANLRRTQALLGVSQSSQWPQGSVDANYQASKNGTISPADDQTTLHGKSLGANASWIIDLNGKLRHATEAARAQSQEAGYLWQAVQLNIISQVVASYGDYRGAELRLAVARENLNNLQQSRQIVEAQFKSGIASQLDLVRLEAQVSQVESTIPQRTSELAAAESVISSLVAATPDSLGLSTRTFPVLKTPLLLKTHENQLQSRPDIAAKEQALLAAIANVDVAKADLYPEVQLNGFLGFMAASDQGLSADTKSWSIIPSISWNILNYANVKNRIHANEASADMALADFEQTVFESLNEMDYSIKAYNFSREQELLMQKNVDSTEKAVTIARQSYHAGIGDFLDLLDSERQLLQAKDQQAQVQIQTFARTVDVYKAFAGDI